MQAKTLLNMPIKRTLATFSKTHFDDETHYIFFKKLKYFLSLTLKNIGSLLGHEIITVREGTVAKRLSLFGRPISTNQFF